MLSLCYPLAFILSLALSHPLFFFFFFFPPLYHDSFISLLSTHPPSLSGPQSGVAFIPNDDHACEKKSRKVLAKSASQGPSGGSETVDLLHPSLLVVMRPVEAMAA